MKNSTNTFTTTTKKKKKKKKKVSFTIRRGVISDGKISEGDFPVFSRDGSLSLVSFFFVKSFCSHHGPHYHPKTFKSYYCMK